MTIEINYPFPRISQPSGVVGAAAGVAPGFGAVKVAGDIAMALLLLALTWPLILLLMALVKLTSRGPALYKQVRLGLDGRPYTILKLRTMRHDCERSTGPRWSTRRDPRVTPLGRFLRQSHLDELPQLWNVVRGQMSLVGPRPERPEFVRELERVIPGYRERLRVRPGITGLAQVQLPPDEALEGVRHKVDYDVYYIRCMSPGLDLRIMVGTALKILGLPFGSIRQVLRLPGQDEVETLAWSDRRGDKPDLARSLTITGCTTFRA